MKTPARPRHGAAGAEIENQTKTERSNSTPRPSRQTRTIDVEPNWRRLSTILYDMAADLEREST